MNKKYLPKKSTSKKKFLFAALILFLVLFIIGGIWLSLAPNYNADKSIIHGNLIFTQDKVNQIKALPADSKQKKAFIVEANYYLTLSPVKPTCDSDADKYCYRSLGDYRYYQRAVEDMVIAYLITDETNPNHEAYKNKALQYVTNILQYPAHWPWDAGEDLQASAFLSAVSFYYDYMYAELSPDLINLMSTRIQAELAYRITQWPIVNDNLPASFLSNHYWVTMTAIYRAAVAFQDVLPEAETQKYKDMANNAFINKIIPLLDKDGAASEGAQYTNFISLLTYMEIKKNSEGIDLYTSSDYFRKVGYYLQDTMFPSQKSFVNTGDCPSPEGFWTNPVAVVYRLADQFTSPELQNLAMFFENNRDYDALYTIFWVNPSIIPKVSESLNAHYEKTGEIIHRSDSTKNALYFYFIYGKPQTGHAHPDAGQITLDYKQNHLLTDDGYSYWKMTQTHNTLLVDGFGQIIENGVWPNAYAANGTNPTATDYFTNAAHDYVHFSADIASLYRSQAELSKYTRNLSVIGNYIIVLDEVKTKSEKPLEINFHNADNTKVTDTGNRFSMSESGDTATLKVNDSKITFYLDKSKTNSIQQTLTVPNNIPGKIGWNIIYWPLMTYSAGNIKNIRATDIFKSFPTMYKDSAGDAANLLPNPHGYHLSEKTTSADTIFKNLLFVGGATEAEPTVKNIDTADLAGYEIADSSQVITYLFNKTSDLSKTLTYNDLSFQGKMVTQILDLKSGKKDTFTKQAKVIELVSPPDTRSDKGNDITLNQEAVSNIQPQNSPTPVETSVTTPVQTEKTTQTPSSNSNDFVADVKTAVNQANKSIKSSLAAVSDQIGQKMPAVSQKATELISQTGSTSQEKTIILGLLITSGLLLIVVFILLIIKKLRKRAMEKEFQDSFLNNTTEGKDNVSNNPL